MNACKTSLNVGTGKLHIKNQLDKWVGLRGKSLMTFYAVVVFVVVSFCFMFLFFDSYFVEFLAAYNCWEVLWKKVVFKIFMFNNQQLVPKQLFLRNTWSLVAYCCQSKKINKAKIKNKIKSEMKTKKLKKWKKILFRKKTPQNYHGPWVPNLIKTFFIEKKQHKITMAHKCQMWFLVTRLFI